ncbi:MAG TPA: hypothetical protein VH740_04790 [Vicinamibacterales bacterium]
MKTASFVVVFFVFSGIAHAQDGRPTVHEATRLNIFSADRLAAEVSRAQGNGGSRAQSEPTFTKEKLSRPTVLAGLVTMKSLIGATRIVDMLSGEQLPRIC